LRFGQKFSKGEGSAIRMLLTRAIPAFTQHAVSALAARTGANQLRHRGPPPGRAPDDLSASIGIYRCGPSSKATRLPTPDKASSRMASSIEQAEAEACAQVWDHRQPPQTLCPCRTGRGGVCGGLGTPVSLPLPLQPLAVSQVVCCVLSRAPVQRLARCWRKLVHVSMR